MPSADWNRTDRAEPPSGVEVEAMDSSGHVQTLVRDGNLWWFPDRSMYVYFTPTFWRHLPTPSVSGADNGDNQ